MIVVDEIKIDDMEAKKGFLSLVEIMELLEDSKGVLVHDDFKEEEHNIYVCSGIRLTANKEEIPNVMVIELRDEDFDIEVNIDLSELFYVVFIKKENVDVCYIDLTGIFEVTLEIYI